MSADIDRFPSDKKLLMLTQLYLELRLSLGYALRAAKADLSAPEELHLVSQSSAF